MNVHNFIKQKVLLLTKFSSAFVQQYFTLWSCFLLEWIDQTLSELVEVINKPHKKIQGQLRIEITGSFDLYKAEQNTKLRFQNKNDFK